MIATPMSSAPSPPHQPPGYARTHQVETRGPLGRAMSLAGATPSKVGAARAPGPLQVPAAIGGVYLVYRGLTGRDPIAHALDLRSDRRGQVLVERTVIINRPVVEVYERWRDFEALPRLMRHLDSVASLGGARLRWVAKAPFGDSVSWETEMAADQPNEGSIRFREMSAGRGCEIVRLDFRPPAGSVGVATAALFGDTPDQEVSEDLRQFKQTMEEGEVATTKGQPSGRAPECEDAWAQQREQMEHPTIDTFNKDAGEPVEEADEESFPSSDAPGYAVGRDDEGDG